MTSERESAQRLREAAAALVRFADFAEHPRLMVRKGENARIASEFHTARMLTRALSGTLTGLCCVAESCVMLGDELERLVRDDAPVTATAHHTLVVRWLPGDGLDGRPTVRLVCPHDHLGADRPCAVIECHRHDEDADETCITGRDCQTENEACPVGNEDCDEEHPCDGARSLDMCWAVDWVDAVGGEGIRTSGELLIEVPVTVRYDEGVVVTTVRP